MSLCLSEVTLEDAGQTHIYPTTLTLADASINVLLGQTLAGKTSLMRLMAGLDKPSSGRLSMGGEDVTGMAVQKRNVAMVYQQFINYPGLSVFENIASPLRVAGVDAAEIEKKVHWASEIMRLGPQLARKPLELSGGQQQRCAIARALVKGAGLVLMDEPLANLDYKLREELRSELPAIFRESGAIFVYATTEPTEALLLGGHTATLHEGRVTQFGPTLSVYRRPNSLLTACTFSDPPLNQLPVDIQEGIARTESGDCIPLGGDSISNGSYILGIRPDHLRLQAGIDSIALQAQVIVSEITGSESFVHLNYGLQRWVSLSHGVHEPELDSTISVYLQPQKLFVFDQRGDFVRGPTEG